MGSPRPIYITASIQIDMKRSTPTDGLARALKRVRVSKPPKRAREGASPLLRKRFRPIDNVFEACAVQAAARDLASVVASVDARRVEARLRSETHRATFNAKLNGALGTHCRRLQRESAAVDRRAQALEATCTRLAEALQTKDVGELERLRRENERLRRVNAALVRRLDDRESRRGGAEATPWVC